MPSALHGHLWTIGPDLLARVRPEPPPADEPWQLVLDDPRLGAVRLGGRRRRCDSDTLVVVVHGLGGNRDSPYIHRAARAIAAVGWGCLRVDLRGADGRGEDYYHAALSSDLEAIVASCRDVDRVFMLGYSLGGHVVLRHALGPIDPRVAAVAAVCAPLDLAASARAIDRRRAWLYRSHVLAGLKRMYREVAARRAVPTAVDVVERVRTIRAWDERVIVPRHGFDSADDYYARASVAPHLRALRVRAAWFGARHDPMVPAFTVAPALAAASMTTPVHRRPEHPLVVRWFERGGHVGFPDDIGGAQSLEAHVLAFFAHASAPLDAATTPR